MSKQTANKTKSTKNSQPYLEVCVDSYASAMSAIQAGADRLLLCCAPEQGGLTPWEALLYQIRQKTELPIHCLMRPRSGDYLYTENELELLCAQIIQFHRRGANGFACGCLNAHGDLNELAVRRLIGATGGAAFVLYGIAEACRSALDLYNAAAGLGVSAVAVSCPAGSDSAPALGQLLARRGETDGPEVLLYATNAADVVQTRKQFPTARSFVLNARCPAESSMAFFPKDLAQASPAFQVDAAAIREVKSVLNTPISQL